MNIFIHAFELIYLDLVLSIVSKIMNKAEIVIKNENEYLNRESVLCLKGLFAILVLIHHLYQFSGIISINQRFFGFILQAVGYLSVGMFFFFTGYGMMLSKTNLYYVKAIGKNRIVPLYSIYVILIFFYSFWFKIIGINYTLHDFFQSFLFGKTIVPLGWYLQASFVVYLILWFSFSVTKQDKKVLLLRFFRLLFIVLYVGVCI